MGLRYDFGVGNQSFDTSGSNASVFHDPPNFDCGMGNLKDHPKSSIILSSIGNVADAVQQLFDEHMEKYLPPPSRLQDDEFRNSMFSKLLCDMLGCQHARYEWVTILCKCLSAGHYVANHLDKSNCSQVGYRHTANFSIVLMDSCDLVWRVSMLFNLRQAAGDYVHRENGVKTFLAEIKIYLSQIDASYEKFLRSGVYPWPSTSVSGLGMGSIATNELEFETFRMRDRKPDTVQGIGAQSFWHLSAYG